MFWETLTLTATEAWGLHLLGDRKTLISTMARLQPRKSNRLARALNIIQARILRQARKEADSKQALQEEAEETTSRFLEQAKSTQAPTQRIYYRQSHLLPRVYTTQPVVESSRL